MSDPEDEATEPAVLPEQEKPLRVVYESLRVAGRLALALNLPARDLPRWLTLAVFHELRGRGRRQREIAVDLGYSMRKVALLARALKENFLDANAQHTLPRRIEYVLWAESMSEARLTRALSDEPPEAVAAALQQLVEEGRVTVQPGRVAHYRAVRPRSRLARDEWLARVDGLAHLLGTVTDAVYGRFFAREPGASFARTVSLRVRAEDLDAVRRLYEETVWPALCELDERAKDADDAVDLNVLWLVAPRDLLNNETGSARSNSKDSEVDHE